MTACPWLKPHPSKEEKECVEGRSQTPPTFHTERQQWVNQLAYGPSHSFLVAQGQRIGTLRAGKYPHA